MALPLRITARVVSGPTPLLSYYFISLLCNRRPPPSGPYIARSLAIIDFHIADYYHLTVLVQLRTSATPNLLQTLNILFHQTKPLPTKTSSNYARSEMADAVDFPLPKRRKRLSTSANPRFHRNNTFKSKVYRSLRGTHTTTYSRKHIDETCRWSLGSSVDCHRSSRKRWLGISSYTRRVGAIYDREGLAIYPPEAEST